MWKFILNIVFRNFEIFNEVWEKLLRVLATFTASDVICSLFTKIVFSLNIFLSIRRGLTVCQNILLSVISFSFRFAKCSFFSFVNSDKTISFTWDTLVIWLVGFFEISVLDVFFAWRLLITTYSWNVYYSRVNIYIFLVHGG